LISGLAAARDEITALRQRAERAENELAVTNDIIHRVDELLRRHEIEFPDVREELNRWYDEPPTADAAEGE
jgi:hypothetical protein